MRIVFIRHADPDYSIDSLTEKGRWEAKLLADRLEKLNITDFYCSPLGRARDTALITLSRMGRTATICDWLQECPCRVADELAGGVRVPWDMNPGYWTRKDKFFDKDNWLSDPLIAKSDTPENYVRVCAGLDALLAQYDYIRDGVIYRCEKGNSDTIVLFCHFGVMAMALSHLMNMSAPQLWHSFYVAPSAVTTLITEERVKGEAYFRCVGFADTGHLYSGGEALSLSGFFRETYDYRDGGILENYGANGKSKA